MTIRTVLLFLAFVCFFLATLDIPKLTQPPAPFRPNLQAFGLALWVLAEILHT